MENLEEKLQTLNSNLSLIKSMKSDKAEQQFYSLMEKAKGALGQQHLHMAHFYYEYADFFIRKMEQNIELFNVRNLTNSDVQTLEEVVEEEDSSQGNQAKSEGYQENPKNQVFYEADDVLITQNKTQKTLEKGQEIKNQPPKITQGENEVQPSEKNQEEEDDFEICETNLLFAIKIYQREAKDLEEGSAPQLLSMGEIKRKISNTKSRLGDLYHLNEQYIDAIEIYKEVIAAEEQNQGHQHKRPLAQLHYLIAYCYLQENKQNCEINALEEYIKAITILVNHLCFTNPMDETNYEIPNLENSIVDRFHYLPKPGDSDEVKELKETISCVLDKIQDTHEQMKLRPQFEEEKRKKKEEEEKLGFKEVSEDVQVVKLGTFGNRKKKPEINDNDQYQRK